MIIRIVKMSFDPAFLPGFFSLFESKKEDIRNQPGCLYLEMIQDIHNPGNVMTYSHWESESDLNAYRTTELFQTTWEATKKGFNAKPQAWSMNSKYKLA